MNGKKKLLCEKVSIELSPYYNIDKETVYLDLINKLEERDLVKSIDGEVTYLKMDNKIIPKSGPTSIMKNEYFINNEQLLDQLIEVVALYESKYNMQFIKIEVIEGCHKYKIDEGEKYIYTWCTELPKDITNIIWQYCHEFEIEYKYVGNVIKNDLWLRRQIVLKRDKTITVLMLQYSWESSFSLEIRNNDQSNLILHGELLMDADILGEIIEAIKNVNKGHNGHNGHKGHKGHTGNGYNVIELCDRKTLCTDGHVEEEFKDKKHYRISITYKSITNVSIVLENNILDLITEMEEILITWRHIEKYINKEETVGLNELV